MNDSSSAGDHGSYSGADADQGEPQDNPSSGVAFLMGMDFDDDDDSLPDTSSATNAWQSMFDAFAHTKNDEGYFEFPSDKTVNGENLYKWLEAQTYYDIPARIQRFQDVGFDLDAFEPLSLQPASAEPKQRDESVANCRGNESMTSSEDQLPDVNLDSNCNPASNDEADHVVLSKSISDQPLPKTGSKAKGEAFAGGKVYQIDATTGKTLGVFSAYRKAARLYETELNKIHSYSMQISSIAASGKSKVCRHGFIWRANDKMLKLKRGPSTKQHDMTARKQTPGPKSTLAMEKGRHNHWGTMFEQLKLIKMNVVGELKLDKKTELYRWLLDQEHAFRLRETGAPNALSDAKLLRLNSLGFFREDSAPALATAPMVEKLVDACALPDPEALSIVASTILRKATTAQTITTPSIEALVDACAHPEPSSATNAAIAAKHDSNTSGTLDAAVKCEIEDLRTHSHAANVDDKAATDGHDAPQKNDEEWDLMFELLCKCKNKETNCFKLSGPEGAAILHWITSQRRRYYDSVRRRLNGDGDQASLPQRHIDQLLAIGLDLDPEGDAARLMKSAALPIKVEALDDRGDCRGADQWVAASPASMSDGYKRMQPNFCDVSGMSESLRQRKLRRTSISSPWGADDAQHKETFIATETDKYVTGASRTKTLLMADSMKQKLNPQLPFLDPSFWVLPEKQQQFSCDYYHSDQGCRLGHDCPFIHIQNHWGQQLLEKLWADSDKQLPSHIESRYSDDVLCLCALVNGKNWYTARYSTAHRHAKRLNRKVIFAEAGSTGHRSKQGVYWYPTEDDAFTALRKAVIVTYWATSNAVKASPICTRIASAIIKKRSAGSPSPSRATPKDSKRKFRSPERSVDKAREAGLYSPLASSR